MQQLLDESEEKHRTFPEEREAAMSLGSRQLEEEETESGKLETC